MSADRILYPNLKIRSDICFKYKYRIRACTEAYEGRVDISNRIPSVWSILDAARTKMLGKLDQIGQLCDWFFRMQLAMSPLSIMIIA